MDKWLQYAFQCLSIPCNINWLQSRGSLSSQSPAISIGYNRGDPSEAAGALRAKGSTLSQLNRKEEAIRVYDALVARFGTREEPVLAEQVAISLFNKGNTLVELDRKEEAIKVYDELVARFGSREELPVLEAVGRALVNKGGILAR